MTTAVAARKFFFPEKKALVMALLWGRTLGSFQLNSATPPNPARAKDMFDTFSRCDVPPEHQMAKTLLRRCRPVQEGFELWFARRLGWPLQEIPFEALVGTPRSLSALERILLHIYLTLSDYPPDSATVARELAIHDPFFIDETLRDLANLGAVENDLNGRMRVTDLGTECYSRGQLPVGTRKQAVSVFFDPIAGDFPDHPVAVAPSQDGAEGDRARALDADLPLALAERIDLDTLRRVLRSQGAMAQDKDTVIFAAEPVESRPTACVQTETSSATDTTQQDSGISWRQMWLLAFRSSRAELRLQVCDPSLRSAPSWFQRVLDTRVQDNRIDWGRILGPLCVSGAATHDEGPVITSSASEQIDLSPLPVHKVRDRILAAVSCAKRAVLIQAQGLPGNGAASLCEAICQAARGGAHCQLLWGQQVHAGIWREAPIHDNIEHRRSSAVSQEFLVADGQVLVGSSVCRMRPWIGFSPLSALLAGCSQERRTCRAAEELFLNAWEQSQSVENSQSRVPAAVSAFATQYRGQIAEPMAIGSIHTFEKEACQ